MIKKLELILAYVLIVLLPIQYLLFSIILKDISVLKMWKELVIFILLVIQLYSILKNKEKRKLNVTDGIIIVFFVYELIYIFIADKIYPAIYIARVYTEPLLIYFIFKNMRLSKKDYKDIYRILLIEASIICIYAIFQSVILGDKFLIKIGYLTKSNGGLSTSFYLSGLGNFQRSVGTFVSPNILAFFLGIIGIASLHSKGIFTRKKLYYVQILLVISGVILTFSRSVWLGIAAGILVMFIYNKNKKLFVKVILISSGISLFMLALISGVTGVDIFGNIVHLVTRTLSFKDTSTVGHLSSLKESFNVFEENIMGTSLGMNGPKAMQFYDKAYLTESSYFLLLFEFGIIGTFIYIGIYISIFIRALRSKTEELIEGLTYGLINSITVFVLVTFVLLPFVQDMEIISFYFIFAGLSENKVKKELNENNQLMTVNVIND